MILIWRGLGYWALVVPILVLCGLIGLNEWTPLVPRGLHVAPAVLAIAGVVTAVWGFAANRKPWPIVIDGLTGHEFQLRTRHSLYGLPMQVWGLLEIAAACALALD